MTAKQTPSVASGLAEDEPLPPFDPWTATLAEAIARERIDKVSLSFERPRVQWEAAQEVLRDKGGAQQRHGRTIMRALATCLRSGLDVPLWLRVAFLERYHEVESFRCASWSEAFGPAHPEADGPSSWDWSRIGKEEPRRLRKSELDAARGRHVFGWKLESMFAPKGPLPRLDRGYEAAAHELGITPSQVKAWLPKTRTNTRPRAADKAPLQRGVISRRIHRAK